MFVQEYLKNHSLDDLKAEYAIKVREYDDRVSLNYDQIESYKFRFDPLVRECRGLILSLPDFRVLSRPFDRFFNYGEDPNTDTFDITKSFAYEKIDGSLMPVSFDGTNWFTHTRQLVYAEGKPTDFGFTFHELFEQAIQCTLNDGFKHADPDYTYIHEMVSPFSRIVKRYEDTAVYILGIRHKKTGEEIWKPDDIRYMMKNVKHPFRYPEVFNFSDFNDVIANAKNLPAMDEGYVCLYHNGDHVWRMKVKNPSYLSIAHLRGEGSLSIRRIVSLIMERDHEEYLTMFGEDRQYFQPYIDAYEYVEEQCTVMYNKIKDIESNKEVALMLAKYGLKHIVFDMRYKGKDFHYHTYLENLTEPGRLRLFDAAIKMMKQK